MKLGTIFTQNDYDKAFKFVSENGYTIVEIEPKGNERQFKIVDVQPSEEDLQSNVREVRNAMLDVTDKYVSVPDYPIDESTRNQYFAYRVYLRDYTKYENWWLSNPLTFDEWLATGSENVQE